MDTRICVINMNTWNTHSFSTTHTHTLTVEVVPKFPQVSVVATVETQRITGRGAE